MTTCRVSFGASRCVRRMHSTRLAWNGLSRTPTAGGIAVAVAAAGVKVADGAESLLPRHGRSDCFFRRRPLGRSPPHPARPRFSSGPSRCRCRPACSGSDRVRRRERSLRNTSCKDSHMRRNRVGPSPPSVAARSACLSQREPFGQATTLGRAREILPRQAVPRRPRCARRWHSPLAVVAVARLPLARTETAGKKTVQPRSLFRSERGRIGNHGSRHEDSRGNGRLDLEMLQQGFGRLAARVIVERFFRPLPMIQITEDHPLDQRRDVVGHDVLDTVRGRFRAARRSRRRCRRDSLRPFLRRPAPSWPADPMSPM